MKISLTSMRWTGVVLGVVLLGCAGSPAFAQSSPAAVRAEAARLYLSQSLASLQRARAYAFQVAELGALEGFDLSRYLAELDQVARGLQRYLAPEVAGPGPAAPVGISGEYLLEGLQRGTPPARVLRPGE